MNYRHAYHAGNFADVMKHVLLTRILVHLARKEAPFRVVDTHAGTGLYDLEAEAAGKTAEWRAGVARMDEPFSPEVEDLLAPYRAVLEGVRARHGASAYPGSPAIVRELIRRQDRGVFVELHPADAKALSSRFNAVSNLKIMRLDGWTALHALIPPNERRGLVLVDPPYEEPGELDRLASELLNAARKWPTGIYAGWYPIKDVGAVEGRGTPCARERPARTEARDAHRSPERSRAAQRLGPARAQSAVDAAGGGRRRPTRARRAAVTLRLRRLPLRALRA